MLLTALHRTHAEPTTKRVDAFSKQLKALLALKEISGLAEENLSAGSRSSVRLWLHAWEIGPTAVIAVERDSCPLLLRILSKKTISKTTGEYDNECCEE